jgi:hypothetical protein
VVRSTLYSECCQNVPRQSKVLKQRQSSLIASRLGWNKPSKGAAVTPGYGAMAKVFPILITATPRSGTVFTQKLLSKLGVGVTNDMNTPRRAGMVSWIHVFQDVSYFGPAKLYGSKFQAVWHQVRDPLKSLNQYGLYGTSQGRWQLQSQVSAVFTQHIQLTKKSKLLAMMEQINPPQEPPPTPITTIEGNATNSTATARAEQLQEQLLIYRGLEFYLQWHQFILSLRVPRYQLEELTERKNMQLLDAIFHSIGRKPPNHQQAIRLIENGRRRRQLQRLLQHTNSRKHRATLEWDELCHVSVELTQQFLELSHILGYYLDKQEVC